MIRALPPGVVAGSLEGVGGAATDIGYTSESEDGQPPRRISGSSSRSSSSVFESCSSRGSSRNSGSSSRSYSPQQG